MPFYLDSRFVYLMQLTASLIAYGLLWAWLIGPYLRTKTVQVEFTWLIIPLLFQLVAMTTLVPSVVNRVEPVFGWVVTVCNLITIPIAIVFGVAVRKGWSSARLIGWVLAAPPQHTLEFSTRCSTSLVHTGMPALITCRCKQHVTC